MDYDDEILEYEQDAEDSYDDFDSSEYEEDDFDSGLEGNEDAYDEEEDYDDYYEDDEMESVDDDFDSYKSTSVGKIDPNDRTLTVVVKNTSGADQEAVIFGANQDLAPPSGLSITVEESSHNEVKEESKANPFLIEAMKMSVTDPLQFDNILRIVRRTAAGSNTQRVFQPRNATSPQNFTSNLVHSNFSMEVTGQDSLRVLVKDGITIVFTFTIKARANMGNLLKGRNVAELSTAPQITGIPQLDFAKRRRANPFNRARKRIVRRYKRRRPRPRRRMRRRFLRRR